MFKDVTKKIKAINVEKLTLKSFEKVKEEAFDLNTEDQLFDRGVDSNGRSLGSYAPLTVRLRGEAGLPVDRITLKVTGDFYDGFEGDFSAFPVPFTSSDEKTAELLYMFGEEIFGLANENIERLLNDSLRERIQDDFKKHIFKALAEF